MISSQTTVREVAIQTPASTRLFETLKIDYCCGGNRPLAEACASAGVDVNDLMLMLAEVSKTGAEQPLNFENASLPELIKHILETHHVFTKAEMNRLEALTAKVIAVHGTNHPELIELGKLCEALYADLGPHMFKEEQVLFPYITSLVQAAEHNAPRPFAPFGTVNNPVRMMMTEHDAVGDILRELRKITSDYKIPPDACISYQTLYQALQDLEKDLHQHIHLENNILFPKALQVENRLNR